MKRLSQAFFLTALLVNGPLQSWALTVPPSLPNTTGITKNSAQLKIETSWEKHLVRINSTGQSYQFRHPWAKNVPITKSGIGVVLQGGNILVTAELVTNYTYIEVENPQTGTRSPAKIIRIDYNCNLALVRPERPVGDLVPCELDLSARPGDSLHILQLQSNGQLNGSEGTLVNAIITPYPTETSYLLTFRVTARIQDQDITAAQPVVRNQQLTGLMMRADSRNQIYDVIPAQVIQHFIQNNRPYSGVPRLGLAASTTRDPQFRKWLNLSRTGGIYLCRVDPDSPAEKAGLKRGDVLYSIDRQPLDEQGDINDPNFGKINFNYLIGTKPHVGDEVSLEAFRQGKFFETKAKLAPTLVEESLSPAYIRDQQPGYFILGGLVFLELSRPYLQEWGADWKTRAPQRLVYIDHYQKELCQYQGKVVFLSEVLPSKIVMGFDDLSHLIVTKVNGRPIHSLSELAQATNHPIDGLQKIEFFEDPHLVYLDAAAAAKVDLKLLNDYSIPTSTNIHTSIPPK